MHKKFKPSDFPVKHVVFEVAGGSAHDELRAAMAEVRARGLPLFPEEGWDETITTRIVDKAALAKTRDRGTKRAGGRR